ncbi:hypothetical protein Csa_021104, partial [Cucumis sativus]
MERLLLLLVFHANAPPSTAPPPPPAPAQLKRIHIGGALSPFFFTYSVAVKYVAVIYWDLLM